MSSDALQQLDALRQQTAVRNNAHDVNPSGDDAKLRKETPLYSGLFKYFPDAVAEVARISFAGNQQHNPGQPLHWAREKSSDHDDCVLRHMLDTAKSNGGKDIDGRYHRGKAAWRALAALQLEIEAERKVTGR